MGSRINFIFLVCACLLVGCGGSKVIKQPESFTVTKPLAEASDEHLAVVLDWVIVRDGAGSWAENVDWDEYLIRVQNVSSQTIRVTNVAVFDSLGTRVEIGGSRRQLVDGTKEVKRRYKDEGLKIKAGLGGDVIAATGLVVYVAPTVVGIGALTAGSASGLAAAGAAATAAAIVGPALIVGGIVRGLNEKEVAEQIEGRQTLLSVVLPAGLGQNIDLFFPVTPSPKKIEFTYVDSRGDHTLSIDTRVALTGLHLVPADE